MRIPPAPVRLDGRQRRERFPIARPRSRGSPALHCDAGPKQRNTAGDQELKNLADLADVITYRTEEYVKVAKRR